MHRSESLIQVQENPPFFIRPQNETLSLAAMSVNNPEASSTVAITFAMSGSNAYRYQLDRSYSRYPKFDRQSLRECRAAASVETAFAG